MIDLRTIGRDVYELAILSVLLSRYNELMYKKSFGTEEMKNSILIVIKTEELKPFMAKNKFKLTMKKLKADGLIKYQSGRFGYRVDILTAPIVAAIKAKGQSIDGVIEGGDCIQN